MFLSHYNKSFITCSNDQMDKLVMTTKMLFRLYNKNIIEADIINAIFEDDMVFYSARFLFKSTRPINRLHKNYCNLSRLVYLYYYGHEHYLNYNVDTISNEDLLSDLKY